MKDKGIRYVTNGRKEVIIEGLVNKFNTLAGEKEYTTVGPGNVKETVKREDGLDINELNKMVNNAPNSADKPSVENFITQVSKLVPR